MHPPGLYGFSPQNAYICSVITDYFASSDFRLGILGGGQLGKMLIAEAIKLDIHTRVLDPDPMSPCKPLVTYFETGSLTDEKTVYRFGRVCDLLTIEIENVNVDALAKLEKEGVIVYPQPAVLRLIQDKFLQKSFYLEHNIPTSGFYAINNPQDIDLANQTFPFVQKLRTTGYDGKGVAIIKSPLDLSNMLEGHSIIEEFVEDAVEISVIAARSTTGEVQCFPAVEMVFHPEANLVEYLFCPARISPDTEARAAEIAKQVILKLNMVGILAVEMFITPKGDILVNEVAPRPHNSGHHTIESAYISQYQQHLRAILGMPLGAGRMKTASVMINLLGEPGYSGKVLYKGISEVLAMEGVNIHIYGKKETRPYRKMGHVTILADGVDDAKEKADFVKKHLKVIA
jgi:5-(carboxyamino)imidazole ribonucleotide synthase